MALNKNISHTGTRKLFSLFSIRFYHLLIITTKKKKNRLIYDYKYYKL